MCRYNSELAGKTSNNRVSKQESWEKKRTLHILARTRRLRAKGLNACMRLCCGVDGRGVGCKCEDFIGVDRTGHSDLVSCSLVGQICEMPGK